MNKHTKKVSTVGISNLVKVSDTEIYYNFFFDVDYKEHNIDMEKVERVMDECIPSPYLIIDTNKGCHILSLFAFDGNLEREIFFKVKSELMKLGLNPDYVHYSEYDKLKENFKVLRIGAKGLKENELKFIKFQWNEQMILMEWDLKCIFTPDLLKVYANPSNIDEFRDIFSKFKRMNIKKYTRETVLYMTRG